jgi:hypothetical protein
MGAPARQVSKGVPAPAMEEMPVPAAVVVVVAAAGQTAPLPE